VVSVPTGLILAFPLHLKIVGLWIGASLGSAIEAICFFRVIEKTDWQEVAD